MQAKYAAITLALTQQIKDAAGKVAADKQLKLVVTREGVGYGGTDITADVEKVMNITEKPSPSPSSSP
jgi:Skp family chaperone for outer membrane proteins